MTATHHLDHAAILFPFCSQVNRGTGLFWFLLFFCAAESDSGPTTLRNDFKSRKSWWGVAPWKERRIQQKLTFKQRLAAEAMQFKEAADKERPGTMARELLLRRARQAETASHINEWLTSPGLAPPK
jgi:hypothetical protein